jgi:4-hydroxy-tetrahydrodipicolinate synthase
MTLTQDSPVATRIALRGLYPAPVIPLNEKLEVLEREYIVHIQRLARVGTAVGGVVVNGHAGEVTALDRTERRRIIELAKSAAPAGFKVIAGIEALSTAGAIGLVRDAQEAGADAALVLPPFDYFPRKGMARTEAAPLRFFEAIADEVDLPLVVFQYPLWTGISYTTATLARLAEIDTVVGVKNACWDVATYKEQYDALAGQVDVLAACDGPELIEMLEYGAQGALVGISNVGTALWAQLVEACLDQRGADVRDMFFSKLAPLAHALFGDIETGAKSFNALTKEALVQLGLFSTSRVRGPELDVTDDDRKTVRQGLVTAGLLPG